MSTTRLQLPGPHFLRVSKIIFSQKDAPFLIQRVHLNLITLVVLNEKVISTVTRIPYLLCGNRVIYYFSLVTVIFDADLVIIHDNLRYLPFLINGDLICAGTLSVQPYRFFILNFFFVEQLPHIRLYCSHGLSLKPANPLVVNKVHDGEVLVLAVT